MWTLAYIFFLLVLLTVQTTLLPAIAIQGISPDLVVVFAVYCGLHLRGNSGIAMGMIAGLAQDCLSGGLFGVNTLSKSLIAFGFTVVRDKIIVDGLVPNSFFLLIASLFDGLIFYLAWTLLLSGQPYGAPPGLSAIVFSIYNVLMGPVVFPIIRRYTQWIQRFIPEQGL